LVWVGFFDDKTLRVVGPMYMLLDGVLVWYIRVNNLGFGIWPEPVLVMSSCLSHH
jgi:hypothetical protein